MDKNKSREPLIPKRTEGGRCFQDPNLSTSGEKTESPPSEVAKSLDGLELRCRPSDISRVIPGSMLLLKLKIHEKRIKFF